MTPALPAPAVSARRTNPGAAARSIAGATLLLLSGGCRGDREHPMSALQPEGPAAEAIAWLWWLMFYTFAAVFLITMVLLVIGLLRRRLAERAGPPLGTKFVVTSGIILPSLILVVLLILSLRTTVALSAPTPAFTIRVIGHQWWWEVQYPEHGFHSANELRIPVGQPVQIELRTNDIIHSFWVPRLHGKMDMIPEAQNTFWIQADRAGVYRGQCAEFCGLQHALMAFEVIALPQDEFDAWIARRQTPPPPPQDPKLQRGLEVFLAKCANCHAVAGTAAEGRRGPDLTDLASRRKLAAGTVPNNRGYLAGWILDPQRIKPGNLMPPSFIDSEDLLLLIDYMETLK
jgi:cytochrome c oxidase subunit II